MPGKKRGCLTALIITAGVIVLIGVLVYILLPGLLRPYDLGIKTSEKAYTSALDKLNLKKDAAPKSGVPKDYKIKYGKAKKVTKYFSNEEITSFINFNRPDYYALKNFQFRVNPDNSIETSGTINTNYVFSKILSGKYNSDDAKKAMPMLMIIPSDVNVYFKLKANVRDNKLNLNDLDKVGIMGITIPDDLVNSSGAIAFVESNINQYIQNMNKESHSDYDLIAAQKGTLKLSGKIPSSIKHIKADK